MKNKVIRVRSKTGKIVKIGGYLIPSDHWISVHSHGLLQQLMASNEVEIKVIPIKKPVKPEPPKPTAEDILINQNKQRKMILNEPKNEVNMELKELFDCGCKRPKFTVSNNDVRCQICHKTFNKLEPKIKELTNKINSRNQLLLSVTKQLLEFSHIGKIEGIRTKIREALRE